MGENVMMDTLHTVTRTTPLIEMKGIVKTFSGVVALDGMSFDLYPGEIHCLVGENGAGKSTLMKVLSGAYRPDSGEIIINGVKYAHLDAEKTQELGISVIYQENLLAPYMTIMENIFVGQEQTKHGIMDFKKEYQYAKRLCEDFGIELDLKKNIVDLSVSEQQYVKILKAISKNPKILIMDEPTSMFNLEDAGKVLRLVKRIAQNGVSIIYISHFLKEVKQIADRITVIRDGSSIRTHDNTNKDIDLDILVSEMVGRDATAFYEKDKYEIGDVAFEVKDLKVTPEAEPISFIIRRGEILGVAGMVGSGRTEMANAIVGAAKKYGGQIFWQGKELIINDPYDSVMQGIAYITEDRQRLGLNLRAPIVENLTEVGLQTKIKGTFINVRKFIPLCKDVIEKLKIKMASPMQEARSLSGGNQQKVVLGKWLFTDCDVYIFDEPTRGIDVNAKSEFYKIIVGLAKQGKTILMISSDMPEIISMSDRVMVLSRGRIVKTLEKDEISEDSIIRYALEGHIDD